MVSDVSLHQEDVFTALQSAGKQVISLSSLHPHHFILQNIPIPVQHMLCLQNGGEMERKVTDESPWAHICSHV